MTPGPSFPRPSLSERPGEPEANSGGDARSEGSNHQTHSQGKGRWRTLREESHCSALTPTIAEQKTCDAFFFFPSSASIFFLLARVTFITLRVKHFRKQLRGSTAALHQREPNTQARTRLAGCAGVIWMLAQASVGAAASIHQPLSRANESRAAIRAKIPI